MISIASKAMRNSDYIKPELKEQFFDAITQAWMMIVRVIYLMAPALAHDGMAGYDGFSLQLDETFDDKVTDDEKLIAVIAAIPFNLLSWYKDDIYSSKMANLMYGKIGGQLNPIARHLLVGMIISEQPDRWAEVVRKYLADTDRNSFYFNDALGLLEHKWRFDSMSDADAANIRMLLLAGYAKLKSNSNQLDLGKIKNLRLLPEREVEEEPDVET